MSDSFKVSGKKAAFPRVPASWKFTRRPGGWIIAERVLEDGSIERKRLMVCERKGRLSAQLSGWPWHGEILTHAVGGAASGGSDQDLVAHFPGKVRKLLVQEGAQVKEGDALLMVEAMKMEFPIKAPFDGVVTKIRVAEGQQLSPGDRFMDLEEKK